MTEEQPSRPPEPSAEPSPSAGPSPDPADRWTVPRDQAAEPSPAPPGAGPTPPPGAGPTPPPSAGPTPPPGAGPTAPPSGPVVEAPFVAAPARRRNWRKPLVAAALVAAGVVVGVGATLLIDHGTGSRSGHGVAAAGLPDGRGGFPGGVPGEQRVRGTVSAVNASSITVSTASGKSTYTVSSSAQIIRNGSVVTLGQLQVGDPVEVHVVPSAGGRQVERIIAGTLPAPDDRGDHGHR